MEKAQLPCRMVRCVMRLIAVQYSILRYAGIYFSRVQFQCGYRQGGPLSGFLFVLIVACFLHSVSLIPGVLLARGFCDDWQILLKGLAAIRKVKACVQEFENASGLSIHRSKSKFVVNRVLTSTERSTLRGIWEEANVVHRAVCLGGPVGRGTKVQDFTDTACLRA